MKIILLMIMHLKKHILTRQNLWIEIDSQGSVSLKYALLQYMCKKSHYGYKMTLQMSYRHNGISYIGGTASVYCFKHT